MQLKNVYTYMFLKLHLKAGKKVKVGWRLNVKGKRVRRTVAYGASEVIVFAT